MKILVVSDSHGDSYLLEKVFNSNRDCDLFLHLGDSELPDYKLYNWCTVKGNCDFFLDAPNSRDINTKFGVIHMEHGHRLGVLTETKVSPYLIYLFGHTHEKLAKNLCKTWIFNPGSLTRPRDGDKGSYLIIEIKNESDISYRFVDVDL